MMLSDLSRRQSFAPSLSGRINFRQSQSTAFEHDRSREMRSLCHILHAPLKAIYCLLRHGSAAFRRRASKPIMYATRRILDKYCRHWILLYGFQNGIIILYWITKCNMERNPSNRATSFLSNATGRHRIPNNKHLFCHRILNIQQAFLSPYSIEDRYAKISQMVLTLSAA
jgi:hypothetical protein